MENGHGKNSLFFYINVGSALSLFISSNRLNLQVVNEHLKKISYHPKLQSRPKSPRLNPTCLYIFQFL